MLNVTKNWKNCFILFQNCIIFYKTVSFWNDTNTDTVFYLDSKPQSNGVANGLVVALIYLDLSREVALIYLDLKLSEVAGRASNWVAPWLSCPMPV